MAGKLCKVRIEAGTVVRFRGIPFRLLDSVASETSEENYKFAISQESGLATNPTQAPSPDKAPTNNLSLLPM